MESLIPFYVKPRTDSPFLGDGLYSHSGFEQRFHSGSVGKGTRDAWGPFSPFPVSANIV